MLSAQACILTCVAAPVRQPQPLNTFGHGEKAVVMLQDTC